MLIIFEHSFLKLDIIFLEEWRLYSSFYQCCAAKSYWLPISLTCSTPGNHLNYPLYQISSGLVALLIHQRRSVLEVLDSNPTGVRDFFSFSVQDDFLSRAIAQKEIQGIFVQH